MIDVIIHQILKLIEFIYKIRINTNITSLYPITIQVTYIFHIITSLKLFNIY